MISIDEQQSLLMSISKKLESKITVYAIGGTAMMFLGIKDATLDIDLVFEDKKDREIFKKAAKELGYKEIDSIKVYGTNENQPEMLKLKDERFDLFVDEVIRFIFSKAMKERAKKTHIFGDKLELKLADYHDIILMKCATDRLKDKDDIRNIIESQEIDWDLIIEEAKNQVSLGKTTALFELGELLEHLKEEMKVEIPQEVLDKIFKMVEKQAEDKVKEK
jgi:hypothetical protein